jgi:hypothetical protein
MYRGRRKEVEMRKLRLAVVIFCVAFLSVASTCANRGIVVDTTGMTPEQIEALNWKINYAVALDWYEWELKSYEASLGALPEEEAKEIHKDVWPLFKAVRVSLDALGVIATGQDPGGDPQQTYDLYLKAKAELLAALARLFD